MSSVAERIMDTTKQSPAYHILMRTETPDAPTTFNAPNITAYVGMHRPYHSRGGALSELEYLEYTGHKLGESYEQTKQEALQALGLKEGDIKLTKEEEERLVQAYIDLRYQALTGLHSPDESRSLIPGKESPKSLKHTITTTAEVGALRREFEEQKLSISEQTLKEYESLKLSDPDITFPQYAYEKTIGSKSDIEKVGLGLFTQQALGFYEIAKYAGLPKQEYLDLMQIGLSHKPVIEQPIAHGFLPLQRGDHWFNIGVGLGAAIDIITFKAFAKSITSYVKAPSEIVGLASRAKFEFELGKVTAQYRTLSFTAEKMKAREFVSEILKPMNITQAFKDVFKVGKRIEDNIPIGMKTEMVTAGVKREYPVISTVEGKATKEIKRLESPRVGVEGDILFKREVELKEDPWLKQEKALSHLQKVQETGTLEEALRTYGVEDIKLAPRTRTQTEFKPFKPTPRLSGDTPKLSETDISLRSRVVGDTGKAKQSIKLGPQVKQRGEGGIMTMTIRRPASFKPIQPFRSMPDITSGIGLNLDIMQGRTQLPSLSSSLSSSSLLDLGTGQGRSGITKQDNATKQDPLPLRSDVTDIPTPITPTIDIPRLETKITTTSMQEPTMLQITRPKVELLTGQKFKLSYDEYKLPKFTSFRWDYTGDKTRRHKGKKKTGAVEIFSYPMPTFIKV